MPIRRPLSQRERSMHPHTPSEQMSFSALGITRRTGMQAGGYWRMS
jgi:hypothetical protein